uniref:alpha-N-acetylgalactosaminide alpha-2,6-sialyltransferase n=1 Tax=Canis lupus familiaris TaxID=9615 RepID=A0A8C0Q6X8_CANLF
MKIRLCRLSHLDQTTQWFLLSAVLTFFVFILPSFVKEPNTKPFRHQHIRNEERSPESLHEVTGQAPTAGDRTMAPAVASAQEKSVWAPQALATAYAAQEDTRAEALEATSAQPTSMRGQERKDTMPDTLPPRAQDKGVASDRTGLPSVMSQDTRTIKGRRDQKEEPTATRKVTPGPQSKARTTRRTPVPESQAKALTTPGAGPMGRTRKGATTAAAPHRDTARATPPSTSSQGRTTRRSPSLRAANFKSEPRWDFEEQYSFDTEALQPTCPDSVKVKASKSPWLQNLFLANLTLFLDSSRFSQREWDRLEHFAPPFGFMELNQSLVQKVVTRFPPVPQQQLLRASLPAGSSQCITCAVVGNGGILNDSRVGQEIDGHDHVFRLSGAVTKGYEQDVGTRTSFYGFTAFSITQSLLALGGRGFPHVPLGKDVRYLHFLEGTRDYEWLEALLLNQTLVKSSLSWFRYPPPPPLPQAQPCVERLRRAGQVGTAVGIAWGWGSSHAHGPDLAHGGGRERPEPERPNAAHRRRPQEAFRDTLQLDRYLLLHPDFMRYMKNRFLRSKTLNNIHWRIYRPTTGALLLLTALHLCDQVSAYGFITEGHERFSDHYYDKSWKRTIFYTNHDFPLERTLWKRLHDEGFRPGPRPPQTHQGTLAPRRRCFQDGRCLIEALEKLGTLLWVPFTGRRTLVLRPENLNQRE